MATAVRRPGRAHPVDRGRRTRPSSPTPGYSMGGTRR
ncbi:hypothetical protein J2S66_002665 [Saccharothrix longispora]|uniref:Uncharacterized protein n=1 Tax=Saccharothrix longispora TaxID=33920 RepID=A0ABU1PUK2_9PSEU|nr:hypothetical protein [Saccharothrix longispora]